MGKDGSQNIGRLLTNVFSGFFADNENYPKVLRDSPETMPDRFCTDQQHVERKPVPLRVQFWTGDRNLYRLEVAMKLPATH